MNRRTGLIGAISLLPALLIPRLVAAQAKRADAFAGRWGGILGPPATGLRLVLVIDGRDPHVLVSVDQGGARIPASGGSQTDQTLILTFAQIGGRLSLQRATSPVGVEQLSGTWTQGRDLPLTLTRLAAGEDAPSRPVTVRGALQSELSAALAGSGVPALGAAWSRGAADASEAAGLRAQGSGDLVTAGDRWHIGSITKSVTATMLARLVAGSILRWDTTVQSILGAQITGIRPELRDVTLHQLVTGKSGIATNPPVLELLTYPRREADARASRMRWSRSMLERAPEGVPGGDFIYPNSGFVIAGTMAEVATGKPWEALVAEHVSGPLQLASAGCGAPDSAANPSGHMPGRSGRPPSPVGSDAAISDNPAVLGPAGTIHMSLADLARFARAHADGDAGQGDGRYLPRDAWQFLHTPPPGGDYACGLVRRRDGTLWHNGSNTLWYAEMLVDPATGTGACAAANVASADTVVADLLDVARQEAARG